MSRTAQRLLVGTLCLGLTLAATACNKKAPEPSTSAEAAFAVTGVELGTAVGGDKRVTQKADAFKPNDTIYASVLTSGSSPSAVLKARWSFEDGQIVDETEQPIAPTGNAATEFHISKPDGWPVGRYRLEVLLDGNVIQTKEFTVRP